MSPIPPPDLTAQNDERPIGLYSSPSMEVVDARRNAARAVWESLSFDVQAWFLARIELRRPATALSTALHRELSRRVAEDRDPPRRENTRQAPSGDLIETTIAQTIETYLRVLGERQDLDTYLRLQLSKRLWEEAWLELGRNTAVPPLDQLKQVFARLSCREGLESALAGYAELLAESLYTAVRAPLDARLRHASRPTAPPYLTSSQTVPLSVDYTSLACARYLAGLQQTSRDAYGFDELPGFRSRAKRVENVTVKPVDSEAHASSIDLLAPADELKARTFFAVLALAAVADLGGASAASFSVRFTDLMKLLGFVLGRQTNSRYYWRYAVAVVRYLLIDLPSRVATMEVDLTTQRDPLLIYQRLTTYPRAIHHEVFSFEEGFLEALRGGDEARLKWLVRDTTFEGFTLGVPGALLEGLGIARPMRAIERVPAAVLGLKGPAFWLAWQVAFLRRWTKAASRAAPGKPLVEVLYDSHYLRRGQASPRYKDRLRALWQDVGTLTNLGLVAEPGVRFYQFEEGRWKDVSDALSRTLDRGGGRLTRGHMEALRVQFALPRERLEQLESARRRARRRKGV